MFWVRNCRSLRTVKISDWLRNFIPIARTQPLPKNDLSDSESNLQQSKDSMLQQSVQLSENKETDCENRKVLVRSRISHLNFWLKLIYCLKGACNNTNSMKLINFFIIIF